MATNNKLLSAKITNIKHFVHALLSVIYVLTGNLAPHALHGI